MTPLVCIHKAGPQKLQEGIEQGLAKGWFLFSHPPFFLLKSQVLYEFELAPSYISEVTNLYWGWDLVTLRGGEEKNHPIILVFFLPAFPEVFKFFPQPWQS